MKSNIENLAREAVNRIKSEYGLPSHGFFTGAALGNLIWELKSGNKAVINDIDIFTLIDKKDYQTASNQIEYDESEDKFYDNYHCAFITEVKDYYRILDVDEDGIFNNIGYQSNTEDPSIIIRSFDINSTKVGYSITEDKIYWCEEFEEFIETGKLKITTLTTPAHTALRIIKKEEELNIKLDDFELKLCQHAIKQKLLSNVGDSVKMRFKDRYKKIYDTYHDRIKDFFEISRCLEVEDFVKREFKSEGFIYELTPIGGAGNILFSENDFFNDKNLSKIYRSEEFLFFMRNIYGNEKLSKIFEKLQIFYKNVEYLDVDIEKNNTSIELLYKLITYAPSCINNLMNNKLSEQISIINKVFSTFEDSPEVAIAVLENFKIDKDEKIEETTALILELAVRTKMPNFNKVNDIIKKDHWEKSKTDLLDDLDDFFKDL